MECSTQEIDCPFSEVVRKEGLRPIAEILRENCDLSGQNCQFLCGKPNIHFFPKNAMRVMRSMGIQATHLAKCSRVNMSIGVQIPDSRYLENELCLACGGNPAECKPEYKEIKSRKN